MPCQPRNASYLVKMGFYGTAQRRSAPLIAIQSGTNRGFEPLETPPYTWPLALAARDAGAALARGTVLREGRLTNRSVGGNPPVESGIEQPPPVILAGQQLHGKRHRSKPQIGGRKRPTVTGSDR
jgi:hypothetical protein